MDRFFAIVKEHPYAIAGAVGVIVLFMVMRSSSSSTAAAATTPTTGVPASVDPNIAAQDSTALAVNAANNSAAVSVANAQTDAANLQTQAAVTINSQNDTAAVAANDSNNAASVSIATLQNNLGIAQTQAALSINNTNAATNLAATQNNNATSVALQDLQTTQNIFLGAGGPAPIANGGTSSGGTAPPASNQTLGQAITADYTTFLGRAPDAAGMAYWMGQAASGMSLGQISQAFATSGESYTNALTGNYPSIAGGGATIGSVSNLNTSTAATQVAKAGA